MIEFPISGVETYWWLPFTVAFVVSMISAVGGLSGAFFLLPFQVSILGFTGPGVSPTNLVYNIVSIPSGVYRYWKEKRMVWPLAWATMLGTLPGVFIGALIRINYLPDPRYFKLFVAAVLGYIGSRMLLDAVNPRKKDAKKLTGEDFIIDNPQFNLKAVSYDFRGESYISPTWGIFLLSFMVGIIGGTYGIGGGAIIAPFFVSVFKLPVHTIAGASLFGTFVTSIAGVIYYTAIAPYYADTGMVIKPDWFLGAMFGAGGFCGIYIGARIQQYLPARLIKAILAVIILLVVVKYVWEFFAVM